MKKLLSFLLIVFVVANVALGQGNASDVKDTFKKTQLITNMRYVGIGLGYVAGLSENSPYKSGVNWHDVVGFPILNHLVVVEGQIDFDIRFTHNRDWNTRAYSGWRPSNFIGPLDFFSSDLTLGAYPVVVNRSDLAVVAGPMVGVVDMAGWSASGDLLLGDSKVPWNVCYGLNARVFVGKHLHLSAQYFMTPVGEVQIATSPSFPVTFDVLRISASYYYLPSTTRRYKRVMARRAARKAKREAAATAAGSSQ
jgi:hypothetical protein